MFRHVLKRDLQCIDAIRSTKPKRVPTVMSREEVIGVLGNWTGVYLTIAQILYGAGLRLLWRSALVLVLSRGATVLVLVIGTSQDDGTILRPRTT